MASATATPASGVGGRHTEGRGHGLVLFASILLLIIGCFNLIVGSLRTWGWITLILGILQLLAAAGVWAGNQPARWFAVAVLGIFLVTLVARLVSAFRAPGEQQR